MTDLDAAELAERNRELESQLRQFAEDWTSLGIKPKYGYDDATCERLDDLAGRVLDGKHPAESAKAEAQATLDQLALTIRDLPSVQREWLLEPYRRSLREALTAAEQLRKAEAQPAGTVPVEERLPEQREWVLLWSKSKRDGHDAADHFRVGYWDHDKDAGERAPNWCNDESWFGDVGDLDLVTHWMPLPPPPEPRE